jgi:hypothetical protein
MNKKWSLIVSIVASWFLAGLSWHSQMVLLPTMALAGTTGFSVFANAVTHRALLLLILPLGLELYSTVFLFFRPPVPPANSTIRLAGVLMLIAIGSIFLVCLPFQRMLGNGFHVFGHQSLVLSHWIPTIAWTLKGLILLKVLSQFIDSQKAGN